VHGKDDIVGPHQVVLAVVALSILLLDFLAEEEGQVEDRIEQKANHVQSEKVERKSLDGLSTVVVDRLWVEGTGPSKEVSPADQVRDPRSKTRLCC